MANSASQQQITNNWRAAGESKRACARCCYYWLRARLQLRRRSKPSQQKDSPRPLVIVRLLPLCSPRKHAWRVVAPADQQLLLPAGPNCTQPSVFCWPLWKLIAVGHELAGDSRRSDIYAAGGLVWHCHGASARRRGRRLQGRRLMCLFSFRGPHARLNLFIRLM